ncbi:MAG: DUF1566 domain-containing protein [Pseudomonadota bacterium]
MIGAAALTIVVLAQLPAQHTKEPEVILRLPPNEMRMWAESLDLLEGTRRVAIGGTASTLAPIGTNVGETLNLDLGEGLYYPTTLLESHGETDGTVWSALRTGVRAHEPVTWMTWNKSYRVPETEPPPPTFTILPSFLELIDYGGFGLVDELMAELHIRVWIQGAVVFEHFAQMRGRGGPQASHKFRMVGELVGDPSGFFYPLVVDCSECRDVNGDPVPESEWYVYGARYDIDGLTQAIDLSGLGPGEALTVRYDLGVSAWSDGGETGASAFVGDPLNFEQGPVLAVEGLEPIETLQPTATCNNSLPETRPLSRYQIDGELATDLATGLTWQRCAVGMTLNDGGTPADPLDDRCDGNQGDLTWQLALEAADQSGELGPGNRWRLPNVKELASLAELQCSFPSINVAVFPDTPQGATWTSTPDQGAPGEFSWTVDFLNGSVSGRTVTATLASRLVADGTAAATDVQIFSDGFEAAP